MRAQLHGTKKPELVLAKYEYLAHLAGSDRKSIRALFPKKPPMLAVMKKKTATTRPYPPARPKAWKKLVPY